MNEYTELRRTVDKEIDPTDKRILKKVRSLGSLADNGFPDDLYPFSGPFQTKGELPTDHILYYDNKLPHTLVTPRGYEYIVFTGGGVFSTPDSIRDLEKELGAYFDFTMIKPEKSLRQILKEDRDIKKAGGPLPDHEIQLTGPVYGIKEKTSEPQH